MGKYKALETSRTDFRTDGGARLVLFTLDLCGLRVGIIWYIGDEDGLKSLALIEEAKASPFTGEGRVWMQCIPVVLE